MVKRIVKFLALILLLIAISTLGYLGLKTPSNDRNWRPELSRTTYGTINGDIVTLHNIRDFDWTTENNAIAKWKTETFNLNALTSTDMILSVWNSPLIAHTLVSFGFQDGRYVTFSLEIRRQMGQKYSPIAGFFKQYEQALIAATERDIIYLRTNIRQEDVTLYPINLTPQQRKDLFLSYVTRANDLQEKPKFYNTLLANCTTVPYALVKSFAPNVPFDYRVLISGLLPEYLYDLNLLLPQNTALDTIKSHAHITQKAIRHNADKDFSKHIRS